MTTPPMSSDTAWPSRRTVMKAYGLWLDYAQWKHRVMLGEEDPPEGDDIADMARSVINCEQEYQRLAAAYIGRATPTSNIKDNPA